MAVIEPLSRSTSRRAALEVVQAIGQACPVSIDQAIAEVRAAADRLGAVLSDHAVVVQRAGAAVGELDLRLEAAQGSGTMAFFNSEFRKRRLAAAKSGVKFIPYWEARRTGCARYWHQLQRGRSVSELMQAVFDAPAKLRVATTTAPDPAKGQGPLSKLTRWAGEIPEPPLHTAGCPAPRAGSPYRRYLDGRQDL